MTGVARTIPLAVLAAGLAVAAGCGSDGPGADPGTTAPRAAAPATGVQAPGLIAFRRYADASQTSGAVFTIRPDGTGETQVTHPPPATVDDQPAFSADGSTIAFERCPGDPSLPCRAWTVDRDGTGEREIRIGCPGGPVCDSSGPAWSQDGRIALNLAWGRVKSGTWGNQIDHSAIVVLDPRDGSRRVIARLDGFQGDVGSPAWSPDGTKVVYTRQWSPISGRKGLALFVAPASGGAARRLTPDALAGGDHPAWSPDGRWISFRTHADEEEGTVPSALSLIHPDGTGLRRLDTPQDDVLSTGFSPDGRWIAFGGPGVGGTYDVWAMRTTGPADAHPVTRTETWDSAPDWGP